MTITNSDGLWRFGVDYESIPQEQPFISDTDGDTLDNDIVLTEMPLDLKLTVTMQQYTELLSAAINGANRHYGENYIDVIYPLIKAGKNLAGNMSCDDVADCIDTSEAVLNSLLQQLTANSYTQNLDNATNPTTPQLSAEQLASSLTSGITDCSIPAKDMAICRAIVRELHESTVDAFEQFELSTNTAEGTGLLLGFIPATKTAENLIEFVDWVLETLVETYLAAYTQSAEDEIACALFCELRDACTLSYDSIIEVYRNLGSLTVPSLDDIDALLQFAIDTPLSIDTTGVAIWHYHMLRMIQFGETLGISFNNLKTAMKAASTWLDYTYEECDDCPPSDTPTTYWKIYYDFALSQYDTVVANLSGTNTSEYIGGVGYRSKAGSDSLVQIKNSDFGAPYNIAAFAMLNQRRGSTGNGTADTWGITYYSGINQTTQVGSQSGGFVTCVENDCYFAEIDTTPTINNVRSWLVTARVAPPVDYPNVFCMVYRMVIYGVAGPGNTKPPNAVWAGNSLPALADLIQ